MRRLLSSLAAVSLLTVQQAQAELDCLQPQERSVVEVAALRSELMVLATGCRQDERYNAFIRKYQPDLMGNEKAVGGRVQAHVRQARRSRNTTGSPPTSPTANHPPACISAPISARATARSSPR